MCKATRDADPDADTTVVAVNNSTNATTEIKDTKMYVPVVTLSTEDHNKLFKHWKIGFKRTIKLNKYRSEISNQAKTNNLNYLSDPIFNKVNRLFVLSFENEDDGRTSFSKYYTPKIETKDFNVLIDGKRFLNLPISNKEEAYEKIIEMSKNNDYIKQQIFLLARLIETKKQYFLSLKNQKKQLLNFHKILWVSYKMSNDSSNEESKFATKNSVLLTVKQEKGNTPKQFYTIWDIKN